MMTPRSSCPGGESTPLQGANLRLNYEINNVTDTALGNLAGATIILAGISRGPQLQTAWVTFGKQRRVNSGARRSTWGIGDLFRKEFLEPDQLRSLPARHLHSDI